MPEMDHQQAVASQAVEKYLLGEMSVAERLSFEEHYFGCAECAADVEAGAILAANVRAVFREEENRVRTAEGPSVRWFDWRWAAVALSGLLLLVAYQELVRIPRIRSETAALRRPQTFATVFLKPVARSGEQVVQVARGAPLVALSFDVPPGAAGNSFECRLSEAGRVRWTVQAPPPGPGEPINVLIPAQAVAPGEYTLTLSGSGRELARFEFTLKFK